MGIFYRPDDGVAADFIPFYWQGDYHLFYLKDYRDIPGHGEGTPWWHIVTRDFVHFEDWGEALARGPQDAQDLMVFTGCVLEARGHVPHLLHRPQPPLFRASGGPRRAGCTPPAATCAPGPRRTSPSFPRPRTATRRTTGATRSSSGTRRPGSTGCCWRRA